MSKVKRYDVVVKGRVQDVSYRKRVESTADLLRIRGYDFNDLDGTVKIVCEGPEEMLERFLEDINIKESPSGISVDEINKKEISIVFSLPPGFARLETEELAGIGRKMDIGNERLGEIKRDTGEIKRDTGEIKRDTGEIKNILEENSETLHKNTEILEMHTGILKENTSLLKDIKGSLDSLPHKIAKSLKNLLSS